jgi:NADH dehydrogenase [ubiquinone] 1 alpha subcomplex assembly factor 7
VITHPTTVLTEALRQQIHREGPIPFDRFMATALYEDTGGFFARGHGPGRAGRDFVTSPETGSLFGLMVARFVDRWWERLERPDPFVVVDAGAGTGRLAADVLRAAPTCAPALRYVLVEASAQLREEQRDRLPIEPADRAFGPASPGDPGDAPVAVTGLGPIVTALDELPVGIEHGVVIANELLDNLPVRIVEWTGARWDEIRVGAEGDAFTEIVIPAPPALAAEADMVRAGAVVAPGTRLPVPTGTAAWVATVATVLHRGAFVVADYAADVAALVARGPRDWLRTYRAHARGTDPLDRPGEQDITCDVPIEHLLTTTRRAGFVLEEHTRQRDWLQSLGVDEIVSEAAAATRAEPARTDLDALVARSRVSEAAALTDPAGLGAHHVFVFSKGVARKKRR